LSPTAQNHYADLEDTCSDKVTKVGVIVRCTKNVIERKRRLGSNLTPGGLLRVNEHNHSFGTVDTTMQILQHHRKSAHLNTLERFYIHKEAATDNYQNDEHTVLPNKIFDAIMRIENNPPPPAKSPTITPKTKPTTLLPITIKRKLITQPRTENKNSLVPK
jgi:hypothetical protein